MAAATCKKIRMVAGLGNPGEEYKDTRHNADSKQLTSLLDRLASRIGKTSWVRKSLPSRCTIQRQRAGDARFCWSSRSPS